MKAGIYLGKENVEIRELPVPSVGDDDVLIQNIYSSICGTDAAVYTHGPNTGHKVDVGGEFGHETVSRVVKIGKNVTEFQVGQRVYPYPYCAKNDPARAGGFLFIWRRKIQERFQDSRKEKIVAPVSVSDPHPTYMRENYSGGGRAENGPYVCWKWLASVLTEQHPQP